jgi:predicted site-specific integrase-resolvase
MPISREYLTTQAFAQKTGVSASTVSRWLRKEKIYGQKENGKWRIPASELSKVPLDTVVPETAATAAICAPASQKAPHGAGTAHYTVEEFSAMTYLTEFGVRKWLKQGRLIVARNDSGEPLVASSNLKHPNIKRLVR